MPKDNANWRGPWDCAELMSWLVFQGARLLYGCLDESAAPSVADAYTGAWQRDSARRGNRIPVNDAAAIVGGIVLRFPPEPGVMGHIAICDGAGGTVEAKGRAFGVVRDNVDGRRWDTGVLIPGVDYDRGVTPLMVTGPARLFRRGGRNMDATVVRQIQQRLSDIGFDPGLIDGIYGPRTAAAVAAFQSVNPLVVDGEVGPQTAGALEIPL